jgi:hypothetical protein
MKTYKEICSSIEITTILKDEIFKIKSILEQIIYGQGFEKSENQYHLFDINNNKYTFLSLIYPQNLNNYGEKISLIFLIAKGYINDKDEFFSDPNHKGIPEEAIETILLDLVISGDNEVVWLERKDKTEGEKNQYYTSEEITKIWIQKYISVTQSKT